MLPDLDRLIKLQHLETLIADATARIASHPQRLADVEARLQDAQRVVDDAKARLEANKEARRALDKDVALYQGRLTKFKDQLASVKTNREYQAMQHEIATAQSDLGTVEEKVLERMVEADSLVAEVKQAEAAFALQRKAIDAEKQELIDDLVTVEASLATSRAARESLVKDLDPRMLALFDQISKVRKGQALSSATRDGLCSLCHVRLRPHVFQQVRQNDSIHQCESCKRILYWVPPPPPVEHPIVRT